MLTLVATLYAVTALSVPGHRAEEFTAPTTISVAASAPPPLIALSQAGSFAAVLSGGPEPVVLVIRPDGTRVTLKRPPDELLASVFAIYAEGPHGKPAFPLTRIDGVALANDGTPFASLASTFSGAYSGTQDGVFIWNGDRWRAALPKRKLPIETKNVTLGAVESATRFACNGNFYDTFVSIDEAERDPNLETNPAILIDGPHAASLGLGAVTAMRGDFVVGYSAGIRSVMQSDRYGQAATALRWFRGRRTPLGPGIAYGVNASGDAVGENNRFLSDPGSPTLWSGGRVIRLSDGLGAAYALADDGTVVGTVAGHAFLMRGTDRARKLVRIDALARGGQWNITAAYAIAANGRILAVGRRGAEDLRILFLDPLAHSDASPSLSYKGNRSVAARDLSPVRRIGRSLPAVRPSRRFTP